MGMHKVSRAEMNKGEVKLWLRKDLTSLVCLLVCRKGLMWTGLMWIELPYSYSTEGLLHMHSQSTSLEPYPTVSRQPEGGKICS